MSKYPLTSGIQNKALRIVLYGVAGIGKTTLAAEFPNPVFIDVEDGSNQLPVARLPRPTSWEMLLDEVREVRDGNVGCSSVVIDTADAAEDLCIRSICAEKGLKGIEDMNYGKGYTYAAESYGKLLDLLGEVVDAGINVVVVSHAMARKFELPDEAGAFDRYELKLTRKVAPMVKEWADMLLFLNYKTYVEEGTNGRAKAKGGRRVMYTTHHPCWDAKNRFGLADELPLDYASIGSCVPDMIALGGRNAYMQPTTNPKAEPEPPRAPSKSKPPAPPAASPVIQEVDERIARMERDAKAAKVMASPKETPPEDAISKYPPRLKALADLMRADGITDDDLRKAMAAKGYVTYQTPVENYQERLVEGVIASWSNFVGFVRNA